MNTTAEQFAEMLEEAAQMRAPQPLVLERGQIMQGIVMEYEMTTNDFGMFNYVTVLDEEDWVIKLLDPDDRLQTKIDWAGAGGPDEGDRISVLRRWDGSYEVALNWL